VEELAKNYRLRSEGGKPSPQRRH